MHKLNVIGTERGCVGLDVGIFDPDLDPDGRYAAELTDALVAVFA